MFKRSTWLEKYGLVPKIFLVILLFVTIGGLDFILFIKETSAKNNHLYTYNAKLDSWNRPLERYKEKEFEDWLNRKKAVEIEMTG